MQMDDEPSLLSAILQTIARFHGNILTIHQSIPINGVATLTLSVHILPGRATPKPWWMRSSRVRVSII